MPGTTTNTLFTVWVIESKESPNEALRASLEIVASSRAHAGGFGTMFFDDADISKPLRAAVLPDLLLISCAWKPAFEGFIKTYGIGAVWLDLGYQDARAVTSFRETCLAQGIEGSVLDLSTGRLSWTLALLECYRPGVGSLLGCLPAREGGSPTVYCSRVSRPTEIGARIDYLAGLSMSSDALRWYPVVSALSTLAFGIAADLRGGTLPILQLYAAEMGERHWMLLFQLPLSKRQQARVPEAIRKLRDDSAVRGGLAYRFITRECGLLTLSCTDSVLELGTIFSPSESDGTRVLDPEQGHREAFLFRRKTGLSAFNPPSVRFISFPERLRIAEAVAEAGVEGEAGETPSRGHTLFEKAQEQLGQVWRVGSDESFVAYLKGTDTSSGSAMQMRYLKLIEAVEKSGSTETREIIKDLIKRFFALVEDARQRKIQRAG